MKAKGGGEGPLDKTTSFKSEGRGEWGCSCEIKKKGSNRCSWVGHYVGTDGFLSDLVTNIRCDLEQIIWFPHL